MKPAAFDYYRPRSLDEALALLAEHGDAAKPLAGGQSLIPAMNFRLAQPSVLIDLNGVPELAYITAADRAQANGGGTLRIGGMTRQRTLERSAAVGASLPLLHRTLPYIAHPAIRNRGTIGGSLAHADPAAELPAVMLALDARLKAQSRRGDRWIAAGEFFTGLLSTALAPDELLVEIAAPALPARSGVAFEEISRRPGDYALVGVAVRVAVDERGRCALARIALLSVGDRPLLAARAGQLLEGQLPSAESIRAAADLAAQHDIDPPTDLHASAAYRRQLARVLTRKALTRAFKEIE
jgi:aerobic carbon-monoxide dehydrogenase medium subunit